MQFKKTILSVPLLLAPVVLSGQPPGAPLLSPPPPPEPIFQLNSTGYMGHLAPGGLGYTGGVSQVGAFFMPARGPSYIWPFLDVSVIYLTQNDWGASSGLGLRLAPPGTSHFVGLNGYFDYRTSDNRKYHFTQAGVGAEFGGDRFGISSNGYLPLKGRRRIEGCRFFYPGGFRVFKNQNRGAASGMDLNISAILTPLDSPVAVWASAGPYYLGGRAPSTLGGRFRAIIGYNQLFSIEGVVTHDSLFGTKVQGGIFLNFAFGGSSEGGRLPETLSQRVIRNQVIVLEKFCCWSTNF